MNITILGAGAWGSALAIHFALHQHRVALWTHNPKHAQAMRETGENRAYLPDFPLPAQLVVHDNLQVALADSELILAVTPVIGLRDSIQKVKALGFGHLPILAACKGFELETGLLPHQVLQDILPQNQQLGLLSGPSFAQELAQQMPCAVCLASNNINWIQDLTQKLNTNVMRLYANDDAIGVAIGGAVKNVMAIATGLCDGLGYGLNARAALMTRGLAEITRLAIQLGAQSKTMMGLAGMGDLILTCTGALSRNRKVGLELAQGKSLTQILDELGHVAEGVPTIDEVHRIALQHQIDMPISTTLHHLIHGKLSVQSVVDELMQRTPKSE